MRRIKTNPNPEHNYAGEANTNPTSLSARLPISQIGTHALPVSAQYRYFVDLKSPHTT